jgi:hypothetical protein
MLFHGREIEINDWNYSFSLSISVDFDGSGGKMLCRRHFRFRPIFQSSSPRLRRIDKQQGPDGFVVIVQYSAD